MLSDFLFAFMLLRFYFVVRTLMNLNLFSELTSKRICGKHHVTPGPSFCLKALIAERPGITVLLTAVISVMWLSYLIRIFERIAYQSQGQRVFDSYFTSIWNVMITMTTVGYGDTFSISIFGRIISMLNAIWGAFIISLLVASIGTVFALTPEQKLAIEEIKAKETKKKTTKKK
jgi:potassium intermediate/small conductance calcium-activated channel subfamily N protein 2